MRQFLDAWKGADWDEIIIVEDNPIKTFDSGVKYHYSWTDIDETLGKDSWIISRRDSAIRSFGFLMAYRMGADYIFTLDDDCFPHQGNLDFCASHLKVMNSFPRWVESVPNMRTRGLPYRNLGTMSNVMVNFGFWSGIPDLDAIQSLQDIDFATNGKFNPPTGSRILPHGQYTPVCGMCLAFARHVAPLSYFPLMGKNSPFRRFDDIWFGVIMKKICDHIKVNISCGEPFIHHLRASDVFTNLVKEAPGVQANETFWETIDSIQLDPATTLPAECMYQIGTSLLDSAETPYLESLGKAIRIWSKLF